MSDARNGIVAAEAEAKAARAEFLGTLDALHEKLRPNRLLHEGVERLRERGSAAADEALEVARERPGAAGAVGAGLLLLLLRRPILRLLRRMFFRRRETGATSSRLKKITKHDAEA